MFGCLPEPLDNRHDSGTRLRKDAYWYVEFNWNHIFPRLLGSLVRRMYVSQKFISVTSHGGKVVDITPQSMQDDRSQTTTWFWTTNSWEPPNAIKDGKTRNTYCENSWVALQMHASLSGTINLLSMLKWSSIYTYPPSDRRQAQSSWPWRGVSAGRVPIVLCLFFILYQLRKIHKLCPSMLTEAKPKSIAWQAWICSSMGLMEHHPFLLTGTLTLHESTEAFCKARASNQLETNFAQQDGSGALWEKSRLQQLLAGTIRFE